MAEEDNYQEARQMIDVVSKLKSSMQFYDMSSKHQLNFLIYSLDGIEELLKPPSKRTKNIHNIIKRLGVCPKSLGKFDHYPHFTNCCKDVGCHNETS